MSAAFAAVLTHICTVLSKFKTNLLQLSHLLILLNSSSTSIACISEAVRFVTSANRITSSSLQINVQSLM